jgi:hypothetical protein
MIMSILLGLPEVFEWPIQVYVYGKWVLLQCAAEGQSVILHWVWLFQAHFRSSGLASAIG